MTVWPTPRFEVDIEDVIFVEHESKPLLARVCCLGALGPSPRLYQCTDGRGMRTTAPIETSLSESWLDVGS